MSAQASPGRANPRPALLSVALIGLSLIGFFTVNGGFATIHRIRHPAPAPTLTLTELPQVLDAAMAAGTSLAARELLPVGIAQILLGGALFFGASRVVFGGRVTRGVLLQLLIANVGLVCISYALSRPVRGSVVDAVLAANLEPRPDFLSPEQFDGLQRAKLWWAFRLFLGLELSAFGFAAAVLGRRQAREYFERLNAPERDR